MHMSLELFVRTCVRSCMRTRLGRFYFEISRTSMMHFLSEGLTIDGDKGNPFISKTFKFITWVSCLSHERTQSLAFQTRIF